MILNRTEWGKFNYNIDKTRQHFNLFKQWINTIY